MAQSRYNVQGGLFRGSRLTLGAFPQKCLSPAQGHAENHAANQDDEDDNYEDAEADDQSGLLVAQLVHGQVGLGGVNSRRSFAFHPHAHSSQRHRCSHWKLPRTHKGVGIQISSCCSWKGLEEDRVGNSKSLNAVLFQGTQNDRIKSYICEQDIFLCIYVARMFNLLFICTLGIWKTS